MTKLEQARSYETEQYSGIAEEERPLFHVTPAVGWMNDPNGFSVYQGEYHLFYQYYPYAVKWGPMHWGHYKSHDFIHWEMLPAALAPDEEYETGCFSGSGIELADGRHLLMYTAHLVQDRDGKSVTMETQCIAVGDGVNYEKYEKNPVLTAKDLPPGSRAEDFRDPKIWQEGDCYYAVVAACLADGTGGILLYKSPDYQLWEYVTILARSLGKYGEMWECPDFFELDGRRVLLVSPMGMVAREPEFHSGHGSVAFIGAYNPETHEFSKEQEQSVDYGLDFYAPQTMKTPDGRRIMTAWMQCWDGSEYPPKNAKWFGMMTIPRELHIKNGRLYQNPVREIEQCRRGPVKYHSEPITVETELAGIRGRTIDMTVTIDLEKCTNCSRFIIKLAAGEKHFTSVECLPEQDLITVDRRYSGVSHESNNFRSMKIAKRNQKIKLRFLLDRYSLELFVNDGEQAFSACIYDTPQEADRIMFSAEGTAVVDIEKYDIEV